MPYTCRGISQFYRPWCCVRHYRLSPEALRPQAIVHRVIHSTWGDRFACYFQRHEIVVYCLLLFLRSLRVTGHCFDCRPVSDTFRHNAETAGNIYPVTCFVTSDVTGAFLHNWYIFCFGWVRIKQLCHAFCGKNQICRPSVLWTTQWTGLAASWDNASGPSPRGNKK